RPSARSFIERNSAGAAYVYFNYGMHWMLNVLVKGNENGFVLIRALEPKRGIEQMKKRRGLNDVKRLCSGPGKLTQALNITNRHHEMDLCSDPRYCFTLNKRTSADVVAHRRSPMRVASRIHSVSRITWLMKPTSSSVWSLIISPASTRPAERQIRA